ncbi:MAG: 50S ribosomal protein L24 [Euryarchaeota archaeon RBG_19FT_COMBO_56_21]|nr:50S ribosomal protein L24P [uncultured archaeon]AJS13305.1 50S ribosomal protein L24P [uncultured archaeon]OGS55747.1 MAG: 50S ribosomal protein L24 [Euryarchaeota archaeon RBG_19FT_COMBO_56_21]
MMTTSTKARKQRKARYNAPLHKKRRMVSAHLDSALMSEYNVRSLPVRKGDTVKVVRGNEDFRKIESKVARVDVKNLKIIVENVTVAKADGTQKPKPIDPSDVVITKLDLSDPWRKEKLDSLKGA